MTPNAFKPLCRLERREPGLWVCINHGCGREVKVPDERHLPNALCRGNPDRLAETAAPEMPPELAEAIAKEAPRRGMLAGDLLAALTTAIGIPPCKGCTRRKKWLNRAHAWLRGD
jgi:hypothetical protein